ncbi:MAG: hypothetical protein LBJ63_08310 [Prevotellaceae bacterium]|jgi:hypothetical protein|nr:hypothetical protein [Prevotellaceae bacterium]
MKTKESLFNDLVRYTRFVWQIPNMQRISPLIQFMMEGICDELHLLYGKLDDTNLDILEKLVKNLSPSVFNYVRPGHAVLHIKTDASLPELRLDRTTSFYVKTPPLDFKEQNMSSLLFTPVTDTRLTDASITRLFCKNTMWETDAVGNRTMLFQSERKAKYNTVWFGMEMATSVRMLKDLPFYIDFPYLDNSHSYFDLLSETQWSVHGQPVKMKRGLPVPADMQPNRTEKDIINFYKDHYQTLPKLNLDKISKQKLPDELVEIIPEETASSLTPLYWFSITFPPHFREDDIEKIRILLNAFPVINRYYNEYRVSAQEDLTKVISLSSGVSEEFLEIDSIIHHTGEESHPVKHYAVDAIKKDSAAIFGLSDKLEKLIDVLRDKKTAFPSNIDNDKLIEVFNSVLSVQNSDTFEMEHNRLSANAEVARLVVPPAEKVTAMSIYYWNTHAHLLNGLPALTALMAHKVQELNKTEAVFLTPVSGGRSFLDSESKTNILMYYLTAKDRILTKNDIENFCRIELGGYVRDIKAVHNARISPKYHEGTVNVIEIHILPYAEHIEFIKNNSILKDLRLRLESRSPENYRYNILIREQ